MKTKILAFLMLCLASYLFTTDYSVGTIISFSGDVLVDHFGNGSYIIASKGDSLYKNSIVKTGIESKATIKIMELIKEVPPLSELSIAKVLTLESKKKDTGWLDSLINVINQASDAFFEGEENVDLASRGEDEILGKDTLFAYETEEDIRPDYWQELALLLEKNTPDSYEDNMGELELKKGLCYFGLANYQDALKHLAASYSYIQHNEDEPYFMDNLILMLGISHYFLNQYPESINYFTEFLFRNKIPEYKPFAYWLLLDSLVATGREGEVGILRKKAEESCKNSILEGGFLIFLKDIS